MHRLSAILFLCLSIAPSAWAEVLQLEYEGFTVLVDCDRRGPVLFHYIAQADSGRLPRASSYKVDENAPARCQSKSMDTFQSVIMVPGLAYDVGHQVPADYFDGSATAIAQTNFWTNLVPQTAS